VKILFHIPSQALLDTYKNVCRVLHGNDKIIFDAMVTITRGSRRAFIPPSNPSEFNQKHAEIERQLRYADLLKGRDLAMHLMEKIWSQIVTLGGLPGLYNDDLLEVIAFQTMDDVRIRLTPDLRWAAEWDVSLHAHNVNDESRILLEVQDRNWGEIVPTHLLQLLHTAIQAYKQGMNASAVALLAICVEGTLRDVLTTRGYSFDRSALSVDEYPYTEADVSIDSASYLLTFRGAMPKSPGDFLLSTGGASSIEVKIRRVINARKKRTDLSIIAPSCLLDHWSKNVPSQLAQKRVNGLGEALDIARNIENFLSADILPEDFDDVIQVVRNNLIHATGDSLNVPLLVYDPSGHFTLKDFLEDPLKVYDLVTNVPNFIDLQYIELRKAGYLDAITKVV
jgi:hypothetical protein